MAAENLAQVVIIGAGFDSRAYRFGKDMPDVRFFELDLPATQKRKKEQVKAAFGGLPKWVSYIPIDYRNHPIFAALKGAGYDKTQKTLFIWEGTSRFTDPRVVDQTLRSIVENSAPGSEVVLGYTVDAVVRSDYSRYPGARFTAVRMSAAGEPLVFGIAEDRAVAFFSHRGLTAISDLGPEALARRYLMRSDGTLDGTPTPYERVMHARVGP
jgi:methyltransferase (TIGR00027 family)